MSLWKSLSFDIILWSFFFFFHVLFIYQLSEIADWLCGFSHIKLVGYSKSGEQGRTSLSPNIILHLFSSGGFSEGFFGHNNLVLSFI